MPAKLAISFTLKSVCLDWALQGQPLCGIAHLDRSYSGFAPMALAGSSIPIRWESSDMRSVPIPSRQFSSLVVA